MTIHDRLTAVFRIVFNDDSLELRDEMTARDIPDWDSLANINLMFSVEQEFGMRLRDDQFASFENVGDLERFLDERAA
jgi:acyl carrier protein